MEIGAQLQLSQLQPVLDQRERSKVLAVVVHEIEGEHGEFMLPWPPVGGGNQGGLRWWGR
jgi:hypothetical protein